jgi:predicted TIM-barrel fold metal-dependent hydrolase
MHMSVDKLAWIDSHAHVFDENCIFSKSARYIPKHAVPPERYLALLDQHGIGGAVLVQPSFLGIDNSCLTRTIAMRPDRLRGVAVVADDVDPDTLHALRAQGVRGIRLNLIGLPDPDFTTPAWRQWLKNVREADLPVDLHASGERWCNLLPPLHDQGVTVVIEHFGRPGHPNPMECKGFQQILAAPARGPSWVKVSAPYRMAPEAADSAVTELLKAFGPERMLWGSDFPWTQHEEGQSMAACMSSCMAWMEAKQLTVQQRQGIVGGNARILYDLPA